MIVDNKVVFWGLPWWSSGWGSELKGTDVPCGTVKLRFKNRQYFYL